MAKATKKLQKLLTFTVETAVSGDTEEECQGKIDDMIKELEETLSYVELTKVQDA